MADGYPIEAQLANTIEPQKEWIKQWPYSPAVFLTHPGRGARGSRGRARSSASRIWPRRSRKLVEAEQQALEAGQDAARRRSTPPTTASTRATSRRSSCAASREQGGLFTLEDLANWKVQLEEPLHTSYRGIDVYKLPMWTAGAGAARRR